MYIRKPLAIRGNLQKKFRLMMMMMRMSEDDEDDESDSYFRQVAGIKGSGKQCSNLQKRMYVMTLP